MEYLYELMLAGLGVFVGWLLSAVVGPLCARSKRSLVQRFGRAVAGLLPMTYEKQWKFEPARELIDPARIPAMTRDELYPIYKDAVRKKNAMSALISPMRARLVEVDEAYRAQLTVVQRLAEDAAAKAASQALSQRAPSNDNGGDDGSAIDSSA